MRDTFKNRVIYSRQSWNLSSDVPVNDFTETCLPMNIKSKLHSMSYLMRSRPLPQELPIVIQFPVNDICNSRCQMCRIWENKKSADIEPERLREGLRNPLFRKVQTVGINGGEPTLRKDLGKLTEVLFEELPSLRGSPDL